MKGWIGSHVQALLQVLKKLRAAPFHQMIMIAVIGVTLSLPAGLYLLVDNVRNLAGNLQSVPQVTLFLALDSTPDHVEQLKKQLKAHSGVAHVEFLGREAAWHALQERNGVQDTLAGLQKNPLPDAIVVQPADHEPAAVEALQAEIGQWPHIDHAQLDSAWVKRLYALLQLGDKAVLVLAALLGFALFTIVGNTIRFQILTQREEIEVSRLIGATDRFIRRPFLYAGALQGLLGGIAAWAILTLTLKIFNYSVSDLSRLYASDFQLSALSPDATLILVGGATLLGWLASWWAVSRSLSHMERTSRG